MNRKLLTVLLILAATLMLTIGIVGAQDDTLKIGVLTDLSSGLSFYGIEMQNGVQLGFEYATDGTMTIAGRPVELIIRDTASLTVEAWKALPEKGLLSETMQSTIGKQIERVAAATG